MPTAKLHLTFPEHLIEEPVVYGLSQEFGVVTNIKRANVEERFAWVILEIEGSEAAIEGALGWLHDHDVQVDRIDDQPSR